MKMFWGTVAALFFAVATSAAADTALPAIFRVAGLIDGDLLNVRAGPSTGFRVIATLPNGTEVEVTSRSGDGWGRILLGEGDGWVALRFLKSQDAGAVPVALFCGGTEPFWSLTIDHEDSWEYSELGKEPVSLSPDWQHGVSGGLNGSYAVGSVDYTALFHRRDCSDGMSDRTYGWAIDFLRPGTGGAYLQGCCQMLR